jgi:phosphonopyruvate decarboxylase
MIKPGLFFDALKQRGIGLFAGVPDSCLKHFCAYIDDHCAPAEHVVTANEGNAVALAAGYHLSTGKIAAVYMQNSGLGNAVNPLMSLTDPDVYSIPLLIIIGWRGEPCIKDEPQHVKQGKITPGLLDVLEIPYQVLDAGTDFEATLDVVFAKIKRTNAPAALLVRKGTFAPYTSSRRRQPFSSLAREDALDQILTLAGKDALVVSTTGKTSREVFEIRTRHRKNQPQHDCHEQHLLPDPDFLTVGSMGHTSSIALGVALGNPTRKVVCIDGDGSALMHLGALPVIGDLGPQNLVYILLNNAAHESVGGQRTVADKFDFAALARACGFREYRLAQSTQDLKDGWETLIVAPGPHFMEIRIRTGSRPDLGRPTRTPRENKDAFMSAALYAR